MRQSSKTSRRLSPLATTKVTNMPALCVEQALETRTVQCVNTGHILKRMKGLKKLKRKMGLASRWTGSSSLPQAPLLFHSVCGDNLRIAQEGRVVRRTQSFCKGIAFSCRPVEVNERVYIRLLEVSSNWSGVLRFGFTSVNPESMRGSLPKYVCPDLTSRSGYWAKALSERFGKQGCLLFFYVNNAGDIIYGIDRTEIGIFLSGIDVRPSLWVVVDVYGNSTALQFVDVESLNALNNQTDAQRASTQVRTSNGAMSNRNTPAQPEQPYPSSDAPEEVVTIAGFGNLRISDPSVIRAIEYESSSNALPLIVHQNVIFNPMSFHSTKGANISFTDHNRTIAKRNINEYSKGYVFTGRPLAVNEKIVIQVLSVEPHYVGAMAFGVTSANPANLSSYDLPEDCDELLDRSEYWVVCKDVAASPTIGDELSFTYSSNGQITFAKNNGSPHVIMHVDSSLHLHAFFDVFGHTSKVRILGSVKVSDPSRSMDQQHRELQRRLQSTLEPREPSVTASRNSSVRSSVMPVTHHAPQVARQHPPPTNTITFRPSGSSNHSSSSQSTISPPRSANNTNAALDGSPSCTSNASTTPSSSVLPEAYHAHSVTLLNNHLRINVSSPPQGNLATPLSNGSHQTASSTSNNTISPSATLGQSVVNHNLTVPMNFAHNNSMTSESSECSVCYERQIDSVLYSCGHMCMCYPCAVQQWRGRGGGMCPICRAVIKDVIRTYKA